MKNSLKLILVGVPLLILTALLLSILLAFALKRFPVLRDAFIFPMLVPTAAVVLVWQQFFSSVETALPIYLLFLWKNLGICLILITSALTTINREVYEAARMDGAKPFQQQSESAGARPPGSASGCFSLPAGKIHSTEVFCNC